METEKPELTPALRREKPIIFSAPMVREILAGTKTQTRRIVKYQPRPEVPTLPKEWHLIGHNQKYWARCPYGSVGTGLWVRETFAVFDCDGSRAGIGYKADHPNGDLSTTDGGYNFRFVEPENIPAVRRMIDGERWRPSIHMPRWASRITLEVTAVRVERLQDISEEDAIAEGCESVPFVRWYEGMKPMWDGQRVRQQNRGIPPPEWDWTEIRELRETTGSDYDPMAHTATKEYMALWDQIHGAGAWAANPWVWVVSFRKVEHA